MTANDMVKLTIKALEERKAAKAKPPVPRFKEVVKLFCDYWAGLESKGITTPLTKSEQVSVEVCIQWLLKQRKKALKSKKKGK